MSMSPCKLMLTISLIHSLMINKVVSAESFTSIEIPSSTGSFSRPIDGELDRWNGGATISGTRRRLPRMVFAPGDNMNVRTTPVTDSVLAV